MITEDIMRQLQGGGLFGGGQQAGGFPAQQGMLSQGGFPQPIGMGPPPQMTQMQGMGLGSPFSTERPQQGLPTQGFTPTRTNAMGPNAMSMMGMNPNMPNMVGPTSALPPEMQPQASQLRMYGMEDQLAQPAAPTPAAGQTEPSNQAMLDFAIQQGLLVPNTTGQFQLMRAMGLTPGGGVTANPWDMAGGSGWNNAYIPPAQLADWIQTSEAGG